MSSLINRPKKSPQEAIFTVLRQMSFTTLFKKYSSGNFSFDKISINNLITNETCLVVARFKEFLIYDDNTDFLRRYYPLKDSGQRLKKILTFYETYSKIFPNYLVIKENKYLYKNIRKKQKMIDAINEIKREESENKKKLREKNEKEKRKNEEKNILFSPKIKEEIKKFQKNLSFKSYKNSFDTTNNDDDTIIINPNSISISILNWRQYEKNSKFNDKIDFNANYNWGAKIDSFITNQTNSSMSVMLNALNDNKIYIKELPNILVQYNKTTQNQNNLKMKNDKFKTKELLKNQNKLNKKAVTNTKVLKKHIIRKNTSIKNNNDINNKPINNKKNIYKYAKTSTNATNSSSILSKRIKSQVTSSLIYKSKNKEQKNIKKNINKNNNNIKDIILTTRPINTKTNLYEKTSPKIKHFKLKGHFFKTKNNFNIGKNKLRGNSEKNKNVNSVQNYVEKKFFKCKHISQDFDSNIISKVTDNFLKSNENEKEKNYFTENNNPNLITGNTKINEKKNIVEDKVHVNVRDIIKKNKENENKEKKKKIFQTAQKLKNKKENLLLKISKTKTNSHMNINMHMTARSLNFNEKKRYKSLISKQKTENKMKNKNIINRKMSTQQRSKTNGLFIKNKIKNKSSENKINNKNLSLENNKKDNNKYDNNKIDNIKNDNIKERNYLINNIEIIPKTLEQKNNIHDTKSEPNKDLNKNISERGREICSNLSYSNNKIKFKKANLTPEKIININHIKFKTNNQIIKKPKNSNFFNKLNNSAKIVSNGIKRKFKTFLIKKKSKSNRGKNIHSQKNALSINIINRLQEVKKSKTKNYFYKATKKKNSNSINNVKNLVKTLKEKNQKIEFFKKNNTNRKLNNLKEVIINKREELKNKYVSSFSIKVNRTYLNKDSEKKNNKESKNKGKEKNIN